MVDLRNSIGTLLIAAGTIGGVAAASREPIHASLFTISIALMILGIAGRKLRRGGPLYDSGGGEPASDTTLSSKRIKTGLDLLRLELDGKDDPGQETLNALTSSLAQNVSDLHAGVDRLRGTLAAGDVARITSLVSEAERYLNRTWSAVFDGYPEEARRSLKVAGERFDEAFSMILIQREKDKEGPAQ